MIIKTKHYRRTWVSMERYPVSGLYSVELWHEMLGRVDRVRCESYRDAANYFRAFDMNARHQK